MATDKREYKSDGTEKRKEALIAGQRSDGDFQYFLINDNGVIPVDAELDGETLRIEADDASGTGYEEIERVEKALKSLVVGVDGTGTVRQLKVDDAGRLLSRIVGVDDAGNMRVVGVDSDGNLTTNVRQLTPCDEVSIIHTDRTRSTRTVSDYVDISGGVSQFLDSYKRLTMIVKTNSDSIDVTVEISLDEGTNWTPIDESPLILESSNGYSRVETLGYDVTDIKFTGSNTNPVFIQLLEVK